MKYLIICVLFFIAACNITQTERGLTGTYISFHEHEYGKTDDTLVLTKANSGQDIYQISRHAGVIKIMDGKQLPKLLITETWTLEYNPVKQTLFELKKGKTLIWNSGTQSLQSGDINYKKISSR